MGANTRRRASESHARALTFLRLAEARQDEFSTGIFKRQRGGVTFGAPLLFWIQDGSFLLFSRTLSRKSCKAILRGGSQL